MDVSYSLWRGTAAEKLEVSGESFSFLFDRRYSNRLNRMSRVFFEAYAKATREVSAEEDRFPSLSEIESRMESGAIYAYKDRLMRSTEFFEEVKISGISYLIPRARSFVDGTGTYTDLILDLEGGEVALPRREKPSIVAISGDADVEEELEGEDADLTEADEMPPSGEAEQEIPEEKAGGAPTGEDLAEPQAPPAEEPMVGGAVDIRDEEMPPAEEPEAPEEAAPVGAKEPEPKVEGEEVAGPERGPEAVEREALSSKHPHPEPKAGGGFGGWGRGHRGPLLALAALALVMVLGAFYLWSPPAPEEPETPAPPSDFVSYSAYLTNSTENSYLNLDVTNPKGLDSRVELVLPPDVDKSISATGGVVTISYTNNTVIRLISSNNASISVALTDEYVLVPVTFNLGIPEGYESSVLVYDKDYKVSRTNSTITLLCNCTDDHLEFDQIYNAKRISGGPGPSEGGPENATDGP